MLKESDENYAGSVRSRACLVCETARSGPQWTGHMNFRNYQGASIRWMDFAQLMYEQKGSDHSAVWTCFCWPRRTYTEPRNPFLASYQQDSLRLLMVASFMALDVID